MRSDLESLTFFGFTLDDHKAVKIFSRYYDGDGLRIGLTGRVLQSLIQ